MSVLGRAERSRLCKQRPWLCGSNYIRSASLFEEDHKLADARMPACRSVAHCFDFQVPTHFAKRFSLNELSLAEAGDMMLSEGET